MDQSTVDEWRREKGTMNPADIGSIGVTVSQLLESEQLNGLARVKQNPSNWPERAKLVEDDDIFLMASYRVMTTAQT